MNRKPGYISLFFPIFCIFISFPPVYSQTLRDQAVIHFGLLDWIVKPDSSPAVANPGSVLPGGNETFPVLGIGGAAFPDAIYPELERLGVIGYKDIPGDLLALLRTIAEGIREKNVDPGLCNPSRSFIAPLSTFQLQKLPDSSDVFFSCPVPSSDGQSRTVFRLRYPPETAPIAVYMTVNTILIDGKFKINEIFFEGTANAGFAQPN